MGDRNQKIRIIFVDDEVDILNSLKRILHPMRYEWDMEFVTTGRQALAMMEENPFDIIIADMHLQEMSGAQLLNIIKKIYPQTIRFIFSATCDIGTILNSIRPAHRFLSKPCNPNNLKEAISRAIDAQKIISSKSIKTIASKIETLPAMPKLYVELIGLLKSERCSLIDISRIIQQDISVAAKILQLVNSAFFGLIREINNIHQAVAYLGVETIKTLVLTISLFDKFPNNLIIRFKIDKIYKHSITVGTLAGKLIQQIEDCKDLFNDAITAGILHDIGKLILITNQPEEYDGMYNNERNKSPLYLMEREIMGVTHAEVGGYLLDLWGLPLSIVKAVAFHHEPSKTIEENSFSPLIAVHLANALVHEEEDNIKRNFSEIDIKYLSKYKFTTYR